MNLYRIFGDETIRTLYSLHEPVGRLIAADTAEKALGLYKEKLFPTESEIYKIYFVGKVKIKETI